MLPSQKYLFRGGTAYWSTRFYDVNSNLIEPDFAYINIDYPNPDGSRSQTNIPMIAGNLIIPWTAYWDTRGIGVGTVFWSIHTSGPIPVCVEDGNFVLTANAANEQTFS